MHHCANLLSWVSTTRRERLGGRTKCLECQRVLGETCIIKVALHNDATKKSVVSLRFASSKGADSHITNTAETTNPVIERDDISNCEPI